MRRDTDDMEREGALWPGIIDPAFLHDEYVAANTQLSDLGRVGRWGALFRLLRTSAWASPNMWRIGGPSWFAPLHHLAWHGGPVAVAEQLIGLGAWRALRDSQGRTALDLAIQRGHDHLVPIMNFAEVDSAQCAAWDRQLDVLISETVGGLDRVQYRPVTTEVLAVDENQNELFFAFPGMHGGFAISIHKRRLLVESWSRIGGGSSRAHVITERDCVLVDSGFV